MIKSAQKPQRVALYFVFFVSVSIAVSVAIGFKPSGFLLKIFKNLFGVTDG